MLSKCKWFWLPFLALTLAACGGDDDNDKDSDDGEPTNSAIKVIPASPHAPLVSVVVDTKLDDDKKGSEKVPELSYGQAGLFPLARGTSEFTLRYALPSGVGSSAEKTYENAVPPFEAALEGGKRYEIYLGGEYPNGEYWMVDMPFAFDESKDQARLTLVNAQTNLAAIDVHLAAFGAPIDSASLLSSLDYKEADTSIRVDPGKYQLQITEAGSSDVIFTSQALELAKGSDLSLVAINNAWIKEDAPDKSPIVVSRSSNSGTALLFSADAGADVRVVHASPDAGALDIAIDDKFDELFAEDMALGDVSPRQTIEGGVHNFKVVPANGTAAKIDAKYNFTNGVAWTMFIMAPWDDLDPLFVAENARPIDGQTRLRFVLGSKAAGILNVYVTKEGADLGERDKDDKPVHSPVGTSLSFKSVSKSIPAAAGTYDVTFTRTVQAGQVAPKTPRIIYGPITVTFEAGQVYGLLLRDEADLETITHQWLDAVPAEENPAP